MLLKVKQFQVIKFLQLAELESNLHAEVKYRQVGEHAIELQRDLDNNCLTIVRRSTANLRPRSDRR